MRWEKTLGFAFLSLFLSVSLVLATIELGNVSHFIEKDYNVLEPIKGWINISLDNEASDTLIKGFSTNITLLDFLEKNDIICDLIGPYECSCFPNDCDSTYSSSGNIESQKSYEMSVLDTQLFGFSFVGSISAVTDFGFNVSTDTGESCLSPLVIDLFDDGTFDYKAREISGSLCHIEKPYGCYNSSHQTGDTLFEGETYCGKIIIPPARGYRIGAKVAGEGIAKFQMELDVGGSCIFTVFSGREGSCDINLTDALDDYTEAQVCISAYTEATSNASTYKINYEDNDTCGFVGDSQNIDNHHDFEIFARPLKYANVADFRFDQDMFDSETFNITERVFEYIMNRYNGECDPECIIPVKVYTSTNQTVDISAVIADFKERGLNPENSYFTNITDIVESPVFITSEFLKLDLLEANITVPSIEGNATILLDIGDKRVSENLSIFVVPRVREVFPRDPVYLVPTNFTAILESDITNSNLTYTWDFGDRTAIRTTLTNRVQHTYDNKTSYILRVNVSNDYGQSSKTFLISVASPFEAINKTLVKYQKSINNIKSVIARLDPWIQTEVEDMINLVDLEGSVTRLRTRYQETLQSDEEELLDIMGDLLDLRIPVALDKKINIPSSAFIPSEERMDLDILSSDFQLGRIEPGRGEDEYYTAIVMWQSSSINMTMLGSSYSLLYEDGTEDVLFSYYKFILDPQKDIDELYMVIDGDPLEMSFKDSSLLEDIDDGHQGVKFLHLDQLITFEFLHPDSIEVLNPPVFVSPDFTKLSLGDIDDYDCNSNGKCESGENYTNCRADCKPWKWTILFIVIVIVIAFVIYIVLQEWYKRHYQAHLFKNKNQLFNLIAFMSNGVNQKMDRGAIFSKLKTMGWKSEQLNFAWKKFRGKRTGMWEIPIFGVFERKKVQKEIEMRKGMSFGMSPGGFSKPVPSNGAPFKNSSGSASLGSKLLKK